MKKALIAILSLSLVFSMSACGKNEQKNEKPQPKKKVEKNNEVKKEEKKETKKEEKKKEKSDEGKITAAQLMKNKNARLAFAYGFDKNFITDNLLGNGSKPADYLVPVGLAFDEDNKDFREKNPDGFIHFDVAKAKEHWALAKKELGFNEIEVEFLTYDGESSKKISEYIQAQLTENLEGLTLSINQQPFKNKLKLAEEGKFQFEFAGWGPDYPDPMTFLDMWITGSGHNTAGYSNPEYDKIIKDTRSGDLARKPKERWEALQKAEQMLLEDAVVIPMYQKGGAGLQRPTLKNLQTHQFGCDVTLKHATTEIKDENGKHIIRLLAGDDIPNLDTNKSTDSVSFEVLGNILEGLTMLGENDKLIPGIAKKWDVSEDQTKYTFHLRDAKWSNGDKVVAQDFVDSWRRLANKKTGSQYQFMITTAQIKNGEAVTKGEMALEELGVKAIDEKTLEVQLEQPVPYFLKLMSFPNFYPINKKFVDEQGDQFGVNPENLLSCGAYIFSKKSTGYGYELTKNEKYYDAKNVKNDGVTFRIIKDVAAGVNLYEAKEVDKCGLSAEYVEQFKDRGDFREKGDTSVFYIVLNVGNDGKK